MLFAINFIGLYVGVYTEKTEYGYVNMLLPEGSTKSHTA